MKTLPEIVVDVGTALGLIDKPVKQMISVAPALREEEKPFGIMTTEYKVSQYDPDAEVEKALVAEYSPFDWREKKDPFGNEMTDEIDAEIYVTNGTHFQLAKITTRGALVEALKVAETKFTEVKMVSHSSKMREAHVNDRNEQIENAARRLTERIATLAESGLSQDEIKQQLREDFEGGGFGDGSSVAGSFAQDWFPNSSPQGQYGSGWDPASEFVPIMGGPWSKQLYLQQYLLMHALAFEAYNHNPVAHQLIELTTSFVLGRGVDYTCTNVEVDEIIKEFVARTNFFARLETIVNDVWWAGENITEFYDDTPEKGLTEFSCVDPSTCWEIVTDPEDIRQVYYAHVQYPTAYQNLYTYDTVNKPEKRIPIMKYVIRHIPASQFIHFKINSSEWEKRGRSDLFSILGWLKRLKDLMNARVIKGILEAAFVWDITVTTGQADVASLGIQLPDPYSAGSTFVHNKAVELKPQLSGIRANEAMPDVNALAAMIATGTSTPKEFIGITDARASRSNSLTTTEPGTKKYERRQIFVERMINEYVDRVILNASNANLIDLEEVLQDARSVKRLADNPDDVQTRQDVASDKQELSDDEHDSAGKDQDAALVGDATHKSDPPQLALTSKTLNESMSKLDVDKGKSKPMNDKQKRRIQAIIKSKKFASELVEWTFPAIAQEDRPQKLKDLALSEAMQWLPKSVAATMAAKELNITTYEFAEAWRTIVEEAQAGMSIAHVFTQDNKSIPTVVLAQSVQEEELAMAPADQQPFSLEPTPPPVKGFKATPNKPGQPSQNGAKPGKNANTGDTKVNAKQAPTSPDPTAPSHGYSKAANSPFSAEGRANLKRREAVQAAIYVTLLREALQPMVTTQTAAARLILSDERAVKELEEAIASLGE